MLLNLFKHDYTVRRHTKQEIIGGYAACGYEEFVVSLNVQPLSSDEIQYLPEGERTKKRIKALGEVPLFPAEEESGRQGDELFYQGKWYECQSAHNWDHTGLSHWEYEFTLLPPGKETP